MLQGVGLTPEMPPLEWGRYLIDYLFEVGPTMPGGMSAAPLTFAELESWQRQVGIILQPWEVQLLRRLSSEYTGEMHMATQPDRPAPFEQSRDAARIGQIELRRKMDMFLD